MESPVSCPLLCALPKACPGPALQDRLCDKFGQPSSGSSCLCGSECQEAGSAGDGQHGISPSSRGRHDEPKSAVRWGAGGVRGGHAASCQEMGLLPLPKANGAQPRPRVPFMGTLGLTQTGSSLREKQPERGLPLLAQPLLPSSCLPCRGHRCDQ